MTARRLALLLVAFMLLAGCIGRAPPGKDALVTHAKEVPVPGGGTLVASGVEALGPKGTAPYVAYAHHRYSPEANATRLVALTAAMLGDRGWTMGPLQAQVETNAQNRTETAPFVVGERDGAAVEVKAGRFQGGECCTLTAEPDVGILLVVRVRPA